MAEKDKAHSLATERTVEHQVSRGLIERLMLACRGVSMAAHRNGAALE